MKVKEIFSGFVFDEPPPTPQCHASTLLLRPDGGIIAAWFAGTREKADDVMIWSAVCEAGQWSKPRILTPEKGIPHWNPVLMRTPDGRAQLFYKIGYTIPEWKTMTMFSSDGGYVWSDPRELVPGDSSGGRGPVKNKAIRLSCGRILAPASVECGTWRDGTWRAFIDISEDGEHWDKSHIPDTAQVQMIQPTLWEDADGAVHALMRTAEGRIWRSDSTDHGCTWSEAYPTDVPHNNSGIDCVMTEGGVLVLVCNPVASEKGQRTPLSVLISEDNGASFRRILDLETEDGEFSYPALIADRNRLYITYTWKRKKIAYRVLEIEE